MAYAIHEPAHGQVHTDKYIGKQRLYISPDNVCFSFIINRHVLKTALLLKKKNGAMITQKDIVIPVIIINCVIGLIIYFFVEKYYLETTSNKNDRNHIRKTDDGPFRTPPEKTSTGNAQNKTKIVTKTPLQPLKKDGDVQDFSDSIESEGAETIDDEDSNSMDYEYFTGDEPDSEAIFNRMDLDGDGFISFLEYQGIGTKKMFKIMDLDSDEKISIDEMDHFFDAMYDALETDIDKNN